MSLTAGEQDHTKRMKGIVDLWYIKSVTLVDPYIAACVPISVENPALAYDNVNDRFKVDIEAVTVGTLTTDVSDRWARQVGQVDLARVLGAALAHANPVIVRLTDGAAFQDPTDIRALTSSDVVTVVQTTPASLKATVTQASTSRVVTQSDQTQLKATVYQNNDDRDIVTFDQDATMLSGEESTAGNRLILSVGGGTTCTIKHFFLYNNGAADNTVAIRFTDAGTLTYKVKLAAQTGVGMNLLGGNWEGGDGEDLYLNLSGTETISYAIGVKVA